MPIPVPRELLLVSSILVEYPDWDPGPGPEPEVEHQPL